MERVFFGEAAVERLAEVLEAKTYSRVGILCDANTHNYCLSSFLAALPKLDTETLEIIELEPGEDSKSLEIAAQVWDFLGESQFNRHSLLINLGGGVISDLGGFVASTYMRGMDFINFPTSLLAMVDASVGGKTGVNFGNFKNRVGLFVEPLMVGIVPDFLPTLPPEELQSGLAEMLKHGLIADYEHYQDLMQIIKAGGELSLNEIKRSVQIKAQVVDEDARETGLRKVLNFGHTVGHALEILYAEEGKPISHGYAVALGMQVELSLSVEQAGLNRERAESTRAELATLYPFPVAELKEEAFLRLVRGDKKNQGEAISLSLLADFGKAVFDVPLNAEQVWQALKQQLHG